jgi:hypothetical protein
MNQTLILLLSYYEATKDTIKSFPKGGKRGTADFEQFRLVWKRKNKIETAKLTITLQSQNTSMEGCLLFFTSYRKHAQDSRW